jgi:leader peptidase (prepilin peptidase)/N-methyltransferase
MCPRCQTPVAFYDNIPIVSWLVLLGKCRHCEAPISLRYPFIELMSGLLALAATLKFGLTSEGLVYFAFLATLLVLTYIDLDHRLLPDVITLPGIVVFFIGAVAFCAITWKESLIGILCGGGLLLAVALGYSVLTGREGMGGGDIKLMAMIGAMLGVQGVIFTIFTASVTGTLVGVALMLLQRKGMQMAVPFGPFIAIGAMGYIFFGPPIVEWYLNLIA